MDKYAKFYATFCSAMEYVGRKKMFILPEGGKYYGLYECICSVVKCFELCEMGT